MNKQKSWWMIESKKHCRPFHPYKGNNSKDRNGIPKLKDTEKSGAEGGFVQGFSADD
jgi:hypothetical protein